MNVSGIFCDHLSIMNSFHNYWHRWSWFDNFFNYSLSDVFRYFDFNWYLYIFSLDNLNRVRNLHFNWNWHCNSFNVMNFNCLYRHLLNLHWLQFHSGHRLHFISSHWHFHHSHLRLLPLLDHWLNNSLYLTNILLNSLRRPLSIVWTRNKSRAISIRSWTSNSSRLIWILWQSSHSFRVCNFLYQLLFLLYPLLWKFLVL